MLTDLAYVLPLSLDTANYQNINPVDDALDAMPAILLFNVPTPKLIYLYL